MSSMKHIYIYVPSPGEKFSPGLHHPVLIGSSLSGTPHQVLTASSLPGTHQIPSRGIEIPTILMSFKDKIGPWENWFTTKWVFIQSSREREGERERGHSITICQVPRGHSSGGYNCEEFFHDTVIIVSGRHFVVCRDSSSRQFVKMSEMIWVGYSTVKMRGILGNNDLTTKGRDHVGD